jgi:uncharacterized membrane protein
MQTIYISLYLLIFLTIIIIYYYKFNNKYIAIILLILTLCIIYIINKFFMTNDVNKQCLIGSCKSSNGLFIKFGCLDVWHSYHFLLWIMLGMLTPDYYATVIIISIIWELCEHMNKISYFRIEDPLINIFGYIIGSNLNKLYILN